MTVEEAYGALLRAFVSAAPGRTSFGERASDAARALALAVLDEAFTYDARHDHKIVEEGCCSYHDLRERISKLGGSNEHKG